MTVEYASTNPDNTKKETDLENQYKKRYLQPRGYDLLNVK